MTRSRRRGGSFVKRQRYQFAFVAAPACGPALARAPDFSASSRVRKNVYDRVTSCTSLVFGSAPIAGSTQKLKGKSIVCPPFNVCWLKQKQAVLWKYFAAFPA